MNHRRNCGKIKPKGLLGCFQCIHPSISLLAASSMGNSTLPEPKPHWHPDMMAQTKKRIPSPHWKLHPLHEAVISVFSTAVILYTDLFSRWMLPSQAIKAVQTLWSFVMTVFFPTSYYSVVNMNSCQ
ncbi:hypothetical protein CIB84_015427 [Bambusicola thoracicus]|uniref:Uncharacterized protein n=1 Tax=Bambusicola thoracicus TaxID=9083 RepID=A0A2P4S9N4_BAMTH|nr:hypothetical protein CIB84_015427 [Bambusicola thoracicus]